MIFKTQIILRLLNTQLYTSKTICLLETVFLKNFLSGPKKILFIVKGIPPFFEEKESLLPKNFVFWTTLVPNLKILGKRRPRSILKNLDLDPFPKMKFLPQIWKI